MAYITPADLTARYDARTVGQLISDDSVAVPPNKLATDANLLAIIGDADGAIDAALMQFGRYASTDLTGLTGNSLSHLKRMSSDITMAYCYARRPAYDVEKYEKMMEMATKALERLRKGENVFNLSLQITAGAPTIDGPTTVDYQRLNMLPDRVNNFYPSRKQRLPTDRR